MPSRVDRTGRRYGRLVCLRVASVSGRLTWECVCDCGHLHLVRSNNLLSGAVKSCGCGQIQRTHARSGTREYRSFHMAKQRARNPKNERFRDYGGRGIEFRFGSFEEFFEHLGVRPAGTSLDRINVNGHYEPGNVRWATPSEQQRNRRGSR